MGDDVVALGNDELVLIAQSVGERADQDEEPVTAGRNVRAVLNVVV
jgi:hypothetical protein